MKIRGENPLKPASVLVPIPRPNGKSFVFSCSPIMDFAEFDRYISAPKPVLRMTPGKRSVPDYTHPTTLARVEDYNQKRRDWMIITSLSGTKDMEWDEVDFTDPDTWHLYEKELRCFLSDGELADVINGVTEANVPSAASKQQALESFAASQEVGMDQLPLSQMGELAPMPPGGPANA